MFIFSFKFFNIYIYLFKSPWLFIPALKYLKICFYYLLFFLILRHFSCVFCCYLFCFVFCTCSNFLLYFGYFGVCYPLLSGVEFCSGSRLSYWWILLIPLSSILFFVMMGPFQVLSLVLGHGPYSKMCIDFLISQLDA